MTAYKRVSSRFAPSVFTPLLLAWLLPNSTVAQTAAAPAAPAASAAPAVLAPVVVTATRVEAAPFDIPASIDRVGGDVIRDNRAQVNISESLGAVPGLQARDRQNYAQDVQLSVRGFGARSSFGIRGVRLYVDGIPATFPDGQGQITNVELGSVDRIEVLRGPFSALYGNSSGGVVQVFTEDGAPTPTIDFSIAGGSDGVLRAATKLSGTSGSMGYVLGASHFQTDGYRDHSAASRDLGNAKLTLHPDDVSTVTLIVNTVSLPDADDPAGLSRAEYNANPRSVDPTATQFNTRKSVDQTQLGIIWERRFDSANTVRVLVYDGHRNTEQFQSIPVASQTSILSPGGVISLASNYYGTDERWTFHSLLGEHPFSIVTGLAYDTLGQHRLGFQNFIGAAPNQVLGVQGALRRNELDTASNTDLYTQSTLQVTPSLSASAGVRHSSVRITSADHFIQGANGNDSGSTSYDATLPVLGVLYAVNDIVHLYATAGRGFETPTLNELAYQPSGAPGLNFGLRASHSDNYELGVKTHMAGFGDMTAAVFDSKTTDEIVTLSNTSGRSTYQNAPSTKRTGLEAGWTNTYMDNLRAQAALTVINATYTSNFLSCNTSPCSTPQLIPSGNHIPGVAKSSLYAALAWVPPLGLNGGVEARYLSRVFVNDANSDAAPNFFVASANIGYVARFGPWQLNGFVRGDNLLGRKYAGSVIVNEGNSRFFEPAPGRTWLAGISSTLTF